MSVSKISGVSWDNITKISGVSKASVKKIGKTNAPVAVTCTEIRLAFGKDGGSACGGSAGVYYLDESTATPLSRGTLYAICGQELALNGFYSDGSQYWEWDGTSLSLIGNCRR